MKTVTAIMQVVGNNDQTELLGVYSGGSLGPGIRHTVALWEEEDYEVRLKRDPDESDRKQYIVEERFHIDGVWSDFVDQGCRVYFEKTKLLPMLA